MKTLSKLQSAVAAYHSVASSAFTISGVNLFLEAVNNAIKEAQMLHDFEDCRCTALLNIDAAVGGNLIDATLESQSSTTAVVTGTLVPDVTGTYVQNGFFGGYPLFMLSGSPTYFLYYNANKTSYLISSTLTSAAPSAYWLPAVAQTTIAGSYVHGGTATGTATVALSLGSVFSGIREVLAVTRQRPDGTYIPLDFARADIPIERDRTELEFSDNLFPYLRYPSDAQINARGTNSSVIQRGGNLSIYPRYTAGVTTPFAIRLECFGWLNELDANSLLDTTPSNFLIDYGYIWLQWYTIVELNYIFKTFVPRTEGNLVSPEKVRDEAWAKLTLFDSYRVDSNTTRSR